MLALSFSHEASRFLFKRLAAKLMVPFHEFSVKFDLAGKCLEIVSFEGNVSMLGTASFIPVNFSFGCGSFSHQGVIIIEDNHIYAYEPYGNWKRKIKDVLYDYFEPFKQYLGKDIKKAPFDLQTKIMDYQTKRYNEFYKKFRDVLCFFKKKDLKRYTELCKDLEKIDLSCETSKYVYLIETIGFCRGDEDMSKKLLVLYDEYSPYSCVSIVLIELCVYYGFVRKDLLLECHFNPKNKNINAALKKSIESLCERFEQNFAGKTLKEALLLQDFFC